MGDGWKKLRARGDIEGAIYVYLVDHPLATIEDVSKEFRMYHISPFLVSLETRGRLTVKLEAH